MPQLLQTDANPGTASWTDNGQVSTLNELADPGDGQAIPVTASVAVGLVTTGAETRTIAAPTFVGQEIALYFQVDGGDCVVTVAQPINVAGNNTITFADANDSVLLKAFYTGFVPRWRIVHNDGAALTTV